MRFALIILQFSVLFYYKHFKMSCSMPGCSNSQRFKPEGVSFHMLPRGELLKSWLDVLGKDIQTWTWSKNKVVCSKHFLSEDFIYTGHKRTLKLDAVPYITGIGKTDANEDPKPSTSATIDVSSSSSSLVMHTSVESERASPRRPKMLKRKLTQSSKTHESSTTSTDSSGKRRKLAFIKKIHNYSVSPTKITHAKVKLQTKQRQYRRKLYSAKQKIKRLQQEVTSLKTVVTDLEKYNFMSDNALDHLDKTYELVPRLLMSRYLTNIKNETITHESYPPVLREFACVLQFYSSRAYEYVRQQFALALPHQATIRKWCSNIDCSPGFIDAAFEALKLKVTEAKKLDNKVLCSLLLDEMAIKKELIFDGKKTWGYTDIGISCENDEVQPATEALVVMVVAHQSHWKLPISYFFIKSLSGKEKANIVKESLIRLHEVGVVITSITCDGPSVHLTMMRELGCDFTNVHDMKTSFLHPSNEAQIFCMLDACHMLKLIRNLLATLLEIKDPDGNIISWKFVKALYELQEQETLTIANKLKRAHVEWYRQKMKVNLAAQTLSRSVADALEFLDKKIHMPQFQGSEATVAFIKKIDRLFDIMNSRSPRAGGFKAPLRPDNEENWRSVLLETVSYLLYCTDVRGVPLWNTPRKTPIVGFVISALSICGIFDNFVKSGDLKYLLTYKCSQDHLETFFCSVRSRNGWNNNPNALQFARTMRRLLLFSKISGRGGNCRVLDSTTVLSVPSSSREHNVQNFDIAGYRRTSADPAESILHDHDYDILPDFIDISDVSANVVTYISGFVVKVLYRSLKCTKCVEECGIASEEVIGENSRHYELLFLKKRGGLYVPSSGIVGICMKTELEIRKIVSFTNYHLPREAHAFNFFVTTVAQQLYNKVENLFPTLVDHFTESPITDHHGYILIKTVVSIYSRIRFFNLAKKYTAILQGPAVRRQLTKLILFNHQ